MSMKNKVALVTGGAGFIGSNLVDGLLAAGAEKVIIVDDLSTGFKYNIYHLMDNERIVVDYDDIINPGTYPKLYIMKEEGVDYVFHMAAKLEILHADPIEDAKVNILGTLNVLNACLDSDVKKVIFGSSGAVYGDYKYNKSPYSVEEECIPKWCYGVSKLAAETYLEQYRMMYGLPYAALRYANVYGPREWYGRVLSVFVKNMLEDKKIEIFGDGKQVRDFIPVADAIKQTLFAVRYNGDSLIANISSGIPVTVNELASIITSLFNRKFEEWCIYTDPKVGEKGRKPLELKYYCMTPEYYLGKDWQYDLEAFIDWVKKVGLSRWTYPMRT